MKVLKRFFRGKNLSIRTFILILIFILPFKLIGQGSLTTLTFYSKSLSKNRNIRVYLPEGYNLQDSLRYPASYFLHGANTNHTALDSEMAEVLDSLIANSIIAPMIVVTPDGSSGPWAGSWYTNSALYGAFEDYVVFDLVQFIDATYKTIPTREKRAISGLSMGGFGAMKIALKHPDSYCAVASLSGPLDFNHWVDLVPTILKENGGPPVSSYRPLGPITYTVLFSCAGAFSPNLNHSPYKLDLPLDNMGNFIDSTFSKWLLPDPARLAANITPSSDLAIYFDCGLQDEVLLYPFNTAFAESLNALRLKYVFQSFEGGHVDKFYNRVPIALAFLDSVMKKSTGMIDKHQNSISSFQLYQNYPNPFNPSTRIKYQLATSGHVVLTIYNLAGQEIATLVNEFQAAGEYEITWHSNGLPSGLYFYRLKAGDFSETKKLIMQK